METRPDLDTEANIAEARGFASVTDMRSYYAERGWPGENRRLLEHKKALQRKARDNADADRMRRARLFETRNA